jgi:hypothetical protein
VDKRVEPVEEDSALRQWLCLAHQVLARDLDAAAIEVSEKRAELFKVRCLLSGVDGREQEVLEVLESQQGLHDARLPCTLSQKVCKEAGCQGSQER